MFEADLILWLQSFTAPWLAWSMRTITWLGNSGFYMAAALILLFATRLRPALAVVLALVLASIATDSIKTSFNLPRPSQVDARILDKGKSGTHLVEDGTAPDFWSLPAPHAIAAARAMEEPEPGFASGHASAAAAFALGLALCFGVRARWIWLVVVAWPVLMSLSRMYLGRHFLADAMAGLAVGAAAALLAFTLSRRMSCQSAGHWRIWWFAVLAMLAVAIAAAFLPWVDPTIAGEGMGVLLCIGLLEYFGYPDEAGCDGNASDKNSHWPYCIGRVVCALMIGYGIQWLLGMIYEAGGWPDRHVMGYIMSMTGYVLAIPGTVLVANALRLYATPKPRMPTLLT